MPMTQRCLRITNPVSNKSRLIPFALIHTVVELNDGCSEVQLMRHAVSADRSICKYPASESIDDLEEQFNK